MNQPMPSQEALQWNILLIEDDKNLVRQMEEYFAKKQLAGRSLRLMPETDWDNVFTALKERKADMVVLDIYKGEASIGGDRVGESVFEEIRSNAFVPVIIHTNLPEGLDELKNEFVRVVPKTDGLAVLFATMKEIFDTKVPQIHRAIASHLDHALRDYMWQFVVRNWAELSQIASKPEFVRILVQRLAISFSSSDGVDEVIAAVFPELAHDPVAEAKIHPAEFYIKPPLGKDPALGDVRVRATDSGVHHFVVLWPTCDMVSSGGREPKTQKVLCAAATPLTEHSEYADCVASPDSKGAKKRLIELFKNNRDKSPDRFHFLPALCDIPDLVVDFQDLEHVPLQDVRNCRCLGTIRSPHAESLSVRFERYRNRIGTPDLDNELIAKRCLPAQSTALAVDSLPSSKLTQDNQVDTPSSPQPLPKVGGVGGAN
jgi:hypothetical protein